MHITIEYMNLNVIPYCICECFKDDKAACRNVKLYCGAVIATIINKQ